MQRVIYQEGHELVGLLEGHEVGRVNLDTLAKRVYRRLLERERGRWRCRRRTEIGFFGAIKRFARKVWRKAKRVARKIGRIKIIRKIVNTVKDVGRFVKKVVKSPIFAAGIGVLSAVVPGAGPVIAAGYAGVRAAIKLAEGAAKGNPKALKSVAKFATSRTAGGRKAMALVQSFAV